MAAPALDSMPLKIWKKLLVGIDFASLQALRKVSRPIRDFIDELTPEASLYDINIFADQGCIRFDLKALGLNEKFVTKKMTYHYSNGEYVANCDQNSEEDLLKLEDVGGIAAKDLITILKHQKKVINHFNIEFPFSDEANSSFLPIFNDFLGMLKDYLSTRDEQLKVRRFHMEVTDQSHAMTVLPYLNSSTLERISICKWSGREKIRRHQQKAVEENETVLEVDKLFVLDQWNACKDLFIEDFIMADPVKHFFHCPGASITRETVDGNDLQEIVKAVNNSPRFKEVFLHFKQLDDIFFLFEEFGYPYYFAPRFERTWIFPIDNDENHCVHVILVNNDYLHFRRMNSFDF